ncbi:hypothetical protein AAHC03_013924 [Spirometra sp. Aus1]
MAITYGGATIACTCITADSRNIYFTAPSPFFLDDMRQLITTIQQTTLATEDGAFVALWILTLIDHWNNEHERIIVLTERSFYIIKYDFLHGNIRESRRVGLGQLVSVTTGPLVFPTKSLMP